jgi:hypothetical protein
MNDPLEVIQRWREANRSWRAVLIATAAALAFLVVLAVLQFTFTMVAVRTLEEARQVSEQTRRQALETLRHLRHAQEVTREAQADDQKEASDLK